MRQRAPPFKYMSKKDKQIVIQSKVKSLIKYGLPLMMSSTQAIRNKVTLLLMRANKFMYDGYKFKVKNSLICRQLNIDLPEEEMWKTALKFIHRLIFNKSPPQIMKLIKINKRASAKIYITRDYNPKSSTALDMNIQLFNAMPYKYKKSSPSKLKRKLKKIELRFKPNRS